MKIRSFEDNDAEGVANVIYRNLIEVNSKDYPPEAIQEKIKEYNPSNIRRLSKVKQIFVAEDNRKPVGVAMLLGDEISGVFVSPERAREGIGRRLMKEVEDRAKQNGYEFVHLSSSVTARKFYEAVGYEDVSEDDSKIIMKKKIVRA